jgi:hypothetical protein
MTKKRSWAMEWLINQPAHFLMGAGLAGLVGWGLSFVTPLYVALPVGAVVSRVAWMIRESRQKNYQFIVWTNRDLYFIDAGIITVVIGLILKGVL